MNNLRYPMMTSMPTLIDIETEIQKSADEAVKSIQLLREPAAVEFIKKSAEMIATCFQSGNKILIAGNGGSLCDAMHFAEELTGIFRYKRPALPAIALSDPGHLTCAANDLGFESVFSRAVEALGRPGDIFIPLTTSGNSQNLFLAAQAALKQNLKTIAFLGKSGGKLKGLANLEWIVSGFTFSDRIQEAHMTAIHIIIEMVEKLLFHEP